MREFARAVNLVTGRNPRVEQMPAPVQPLTPFERKYAASGHALWRLSIKLPKTAI